jgi:hypothetical protein
MKVVSYLKTVPAANANPQKEQLLYNFAQGVVAAGDTGVVHRTNDLIDCNVAVIQGWVYENKSSPHLQLRDNVIKSQIAKNKYVVSADANLFVYKNKINPHGYLRYSFNGIFPNTGIYCDDKPISSRWEQISKDCEIQLEPNKNNGEHILLCCQRNGGWSMGGIDVQDWIVSVVKKIRKHSDRPIVVRAHPGDKKAIQYFNHRYNRIQHLSNVKLSPFGKPLEEDLKKCWAVVNHNSSSIVGPIIMGYPAFITDPITSQCAEVAHHNFSNIERPQAFDRQRWLERISMFHWKFSELEDGSCWRHMRNYCQ